jgi:hypothetical protein
MILTDESGMRLDKPLTAYFNVPSHTYNGYDGEYDEKKTNLNSQSLAIIRTRHLPSVLPPCCF